MAPRARAASKAAPTKVVDEPAAKSKVAAKAAPKSNVSTASKAKAEAPIPSKSASVKRKAVEDVESEVAPPAAKKPKTLATAKSAAASTTKKSSRQASKTGSAVSTTSKAAPKKPAAPKSNVSKAPASKSAPKPAVAPKSNVSKASTTKPAPKKVAKKATPTPTTTKAKPTATKRKAEDMVEDAPAKKAKVDPAMKKVIAAGKAALEKEEKAKKVADKKVAAKKAAVVKSEKDAEKKAATDKVAEEKKSAKEMARILALPIINQVPTTKLDVYVFGENSAGELGLGVGKDPNGKSVVDIKRPRINHNLTVKDVGVVQIAVGGMHCVALTHDNKIYTWGVNDQGALGRTTDSGPMKDMDDAAKEDDSDDDSDAGDNLNASEATPFEIDTSNIPDGVKFASVYAGDSVSFALTTTGLVFGWGTFRGNDGILGFSIDNKQANAPKLIPELKDITQLACGTNHVLALTSKGKVFAWGAGEQNQLARRVMARSLENGLVPREFGLGRKKIVKIGCGDYHSFVIQDNGVKWAWGLNTFGQTGVEKGSETDDIVMQPTKVDNLKDFDIKEIVGGAHHTIACTTDNKVLVWGRCDGHEAGVLLEKLPKDSVFSDDKGPRYLEKPLVLEDIEGVAVAAAGDTCMVVDKEGVGWSWGSSENYQTGTGEDSDVKEATEIDNTAVRGKKMVFCGLGGQFGVLCGEPSE